MPTPRPVQQALDILGVEVGDYGRPDGFLVTSGRFANQVRLEGWGAECTSTGTVSEANGLARQLAQEWARARGWSSGVIDIVGDRDVWYITYGVGPRVQRAAAEPLFADEDIITAG